MAKLYPPNIEGTIPAFYTEGTTKIVVPFSMNKAVGKSEVYGFSLKMKYVDGNVIDTFQVRKNGSNSGFSSYDIEENFEAIFDISSLETDKTIKVGQYYKIQLAYIDVNNEVGYYSTIGVVKYTTRPIITIAGLDESKVNAHQYAYTGVYSQYGKDSTEKVYSSRFLLTDSDNKIIKDTGYILHNSTQDDLPYEATDSFLLSRDLEPNQLYYLYFSVKTMNGLECSSIRYRISQLSSVGTELDLGLQADLNYENGYIRLSLICDESIISGTFLISKACSKDDYQWTELKRFDVQSLIPNEWSLLDCTIEQGYTYKYSLQQYNANDIYSQRVISNEVYADFEHAFLYDGTQQLKISYNPKITNFKNNILENKVDTIGSKYPFILRNGNINYKSFDIEGLLSLLTDSEGLFLNTSNYVLDDVSTDLTSQNIASERYFKRSVLEWLNNGYPKLFRSPTEGNFIVRIMNVSLTPIDTLGRMLHSFKATAYEVGNFTIDNLNKYGIIDSKEKLSTLTRWTTINLVEKSAEYNGVDGWYSLNESRPFQTIKIQDCLPGTIFYIDGMEIMIGATGSYYAESDDSFNVISFNPSNFYGSEGYTMPLITYSYQTKAISVFGTIQEIEIEDSPLSQYIGTSEGNDIYDGLKDIQTSISSLGMIRLKKRDVEQVFIDAGDINPLENYTYYSDADVTKEINLNSLVETSIYQIRLRRGEYRDYYQEGYYVDNQNEIIAPFTNYFLDGKTKQIYEITDDLFIAKINDEKISLKEIERYTIQDPSIVKSVIINQGVIGEISYSKQISIYEVLNSNTELRVLYENYKAAKISFQNRLKNSQYINKIGSMTEREEEDYLLVLENQVDLINSIYEEYIEKLEEAIETYKEEHGL